MIKKRYGLGAALSDTPLEEMSWRGVAKFFDEKENFGGTGP